MGDGIKYLIPINTYDQRNELLFVINNQIVSHRLKWECVMEATLLDR